MPSKGDLVRIQRSANNCYLPNAEYDYGGSYFGAFKRQYSYSIVNVPLHFVLSAQISAYLHSYTQNAQCAASGRRGNPKAARYAFQEDSEPSLIL